MDWPGRIYSVEHQIRLTASALRDVIARLARAETNIQQSQGVGGGYGGGGGFGGGLVTTAIPTGTPAAPSYSGAVQLYGPNGSGGWAAVGSPVTVYNRHTLAASVATGKAVQVAAADGVWWLVSADC